MSAAPEQLMTPPVDAPLIPAEILHGNQRNRIIQVVEDFVRPERWGAYDHWVPNEDQTDRISLHTASPPYIEMKRRIAWTSYLYGARYQQDRKGSWYREAVPIEDVPVIHRHLADTVLKGENPVTADFLLPSVMENPDQNEAQNLIWLRMIRGGNWPFNFLKRADGRIVISRHDHNSNHPVNFMLYPFEMREIYNEVADHEVAQRERFLEGEGDKVLLLLGEKIDVSGGVEDPGRTGIAKIDSYSASGSYVELLTYLIREPGLDVEERLKIIEKGMEGNLGDDISVELMAAAHGYVGVSMAVADLTNFSSRHRDRVNAPVELIRFNQERVLEGVIRVARKIRGEIIAA